MPKPTSWAHISELPFLIVDQSLPRVKVIFWAQFMFSAELAFNILFDIPVNASQRATGKILCSYSSSQTGSAGRLRAASSDHDYPWTIHALKPPRVSTRYMRQRPFTKAEILDKWAWGHVKRTLQTVPESFFTISDSNISKTSSSQEPRAGLSSYLDTSLKLDETKTPENLSKTSFLRPVHSRLLSESLVAGRVAVCPETQGAGAADGASSQYQHQRLHPSNACLVGTRRTGGGEFSKAMLDLRSTTYEYSLYPGQPVVVKATNLTGRCLTPFEIFQVRHFGESGASIAPGMLNLCSNPAAPILTRLQSDTLPFR